MFDTKYIYIYIYNYISVAPKVPRERCFLQNAFKCKNNVMTNVKENVIEKSKKTLPRRCSKYTSQKRNHMKVSPAQCRLCDGNITRGKPLMQMGQALSVYSKATPICAWAELMK